MKEETLVLKNRAEEGRLLYKQGKITREECKEYVMPYLDAVNEKSKEIAKKYNTTLSSVENRLYRCRLALKKIIDGGA